MKESLKILTLLFLCLIANTFDSDKLRIKILNLAKKWNLNNL